MQQTARPNALLGRVSGSVSRLTPGLPHRRAFDGTHVPAMSVFEAGNLSAV